MLTLHQATNQTKAILKWTAIIIAFILFLLLLLRVGSLIKDVFFPTPPPPPSASFGKLRDIVFPPSATTRNFTYRVDTLSGDLPKLPDRMVVYKTKKPKPNLLALELAKQVVARVGFRSDPIPIQGTLFQWFKNDPFEIEKTITYDILTGDFKIDSNFMTDEKVLLAENFPSVEDAITTAERYLDTLSALPDDIDEKKTKTSFYAISNNQLIVVTSPSLAHVIRIDFFQKDIDKTPIFYPRPPSSPIYALVASGRVGGEVVEGKYYHQEVDTNKEPALPVQSGLSPTPSPIPTYHIKTAQAAFEELQNGRAYIASYFGDKEEIPIKQVLTGYYIGEDKQEVLMPIIVFLGEHGFTAYVRAIVDEWIID